MATSIFNRLLVKGNLIRLFLFFDAISSDEQPLDFARLIPIPEAVRKLKDRGDWRWVEWSMANWGTSRNACEIRLSLRTLHLGYAVIEFETSWAPPWPILRRMQEMFPDLGFACRWSSEAESAHRYLPETSLPIARSERDGGPGQKVVATLYMTRGGSQQFLIKTETVRKQEGWVLRQ